MLSAINPKLGGCTSCCNQDVLCLEQLLTAIRQGHLNSNPHKEGAGGGQAAGVPEVCRMQSAAIYATSLAFYTKRTLDKKGDADAAAGAARASLLQSARAHLDCVCVHQAPLALQVVHASILEQVVVHTVEASDLLGLVRNQSCSNTSQGRFGWFGRPSNCLSMLAAGQGW